MLAEVIENNTNTLELKLRDEDISVMLIISMNFLAERI